MREMDEQARLKRIRSGQQALVIWVVGTLAAIGYMIYGLATPIPYQQFERLCRNAIAPLAAPELGNHKVIFRYGSRTGNTVRAANSRFTAVKAQDGRISPYIEMIGSCRVRRGKAHLVEVSFR